MKKRIYIKPGVKVYCVDTSCYLAASQIDQSTPNRNNSWDEEDLWGD